MCRTGAEYDPEAIEGLGHPHEEKFLQTTSRESIQTITAFIFDLEYADRGFISPFRRVEYCLAHATTGSCCANRPII